jgi:hypothetical protein
MQYQHYILKGIGPEGIRLKPDPFDHSQGDGTVWHNGERVMSFPHSLTANNYMQVNGVNARSHGYIHVKHLDPLPQTQTHQQYAPPPPSYNTVMSNLPKHPIAYQDSVTLKWYAVGPDGKSYWLSGGSHRRKHRRSCKKRLQKSRSRSRSRTKSIFKK